MHQGEILSSDREACYFYCKHYFLRHHRSLFTVYDLWNMHRLRNCTQHCSPRSVGVDRFKMIHQDAGVL